jgi:hypothetical protein
MHPQFLLNQRTFHFRRGISVALGLAALTVAVGGAAAVASTSTSAEANARTLHFFLREEQQVIDRAPKGPSNGDLVLLRGELLDPKTRAPVGTEIGMYVVVDKKNENPSLVNVVFTPNARTKLAKADQITMQTIFDSVPEPPQIAAITGGTGRYRNARGQIVSKEGPGGLGDVTIQLSGA